MGLFDLGKDLLDIALTPVVVAADVTEAAVKPVANLARNIQEDIKDLLDDDEDM